MTTRSFTGPTRKATRTGRCPTCGRTATRTRTFTATVNPWNTHPDGTPKTWDEVAAEVREMVKAWDPPADAFEHDTCIAERLAPEPAGTAPIADERLTEAVLVRTALRTVADFTARHTLPIGHLELSLRPGKPRTVCQVHIGFVPPGEIVLWAQALDVPTVKVEDGGHCTYARVYRELDAIQWRISSAISKPAVGDRLGGAPVNWAGEGRRRRKSGTVTVSDLAAGLSRMGIPVAVTAGGAA